MEKIKNILGSIRFWIITLAYASAYLVIVEKSGFNLSELLNQMSYWLGTIAGVGTIDKLIKK